MGGSCSGGWWILCFLGAIAVSLLVGSHEKIVYFEGAFIQKQVAGHKKGRVYPDGSLYFGHQFHCLLTQIFNPKTRKNFSDTNCFLMPHDPL